LNHSNLEVKLYTYPIFLHLHPSSASRHLWHREHERCKVGAVLNFEVLGAVKHTSCGTYVRTVVPPRDLYPLALACTTEAMLPHIDSDMRLAEFGIIG
jgi:hypothetical protein